jgi:hypothetical protein
VIAKKISRANKTSSYERLGRYLVAAKDDNAAVMWTRTAEYIVDEKPNSDGEKVLWYRTTNCDSDVPAMAIAEVEITQSQNTRSKADKTYHLVVSFPDGELPTREQLEDIEDRMCEALGYGDHQRISAVHQDTDNRHLHIAINKVNPKTFLMHDPSWDFYSCDRVCREMELKHGLTVDNGIGQGQRFGKAHETESHGRDQTLLNWIQEQPLLVEELRNAPNWGTLHTKLAELDLVIKPHGNGLVIGTSDGSLHVKASSVDKTLSSRKLAERLGAYQAPREEQGTPKREAQKQYERSRFKTENSRHMYAEFETEKRSTYEVRRTFNDTKQAERQSFDESLKLWHASERNRIRLSSLSAATKREAYSVLSAERQRRWDENRTKTKLARQQFQAENPTRSWDEFLIKRAEQGNTQALALLRSRKIKQAKAAEAILTADNLTEAKDIVYAHLKPYARKNGDLVYRLEDGGTLTDERSQVRVDQVTAGSSFLALTMAAERFSGQALDVQGSDDFKRQVVAFAAKYEMPVQFKDAELEAARQRQVRSHQDSLSMSPALSAYIGQRNNLVGKASNLLPHRLWKPTDEGTVTYQGRRNLTDGTEVVLLQKAEETLVKAVQEKELQGLTVGQKITLDSRGQERTKTRGLGHER